MLPDDNDLPNTNDQANEQSAITSAESKPKTESRQLTAQQLYQRVAPLRRSGVCTAIIVSHLVIGLVMNFVPLLLIVSLLTAAGVLLVCGIVLSGPVYYAKVNFATGELLQWSSANKIAAVVIALIFMTLYALILFKVF